METSKIREQNIERENPGRENSFELFHLNALSAFLCNASTFHSMQSKIAFVSIIKQGSFTF